MKEKEVIEENEERRKNFLTHNGSIFHYRMYGINSYIDSFTLRDIGQNNHLILSRLLHYILVKGLCDQL